VKKNIAGFLNLLIALHVLGPIAHASNDHATERISNIRERVSDLPVGMAITVELKDHSKVRGELVAHSEDNIELTGSHPVQISYEEIKSVAEDPGVGQGNPSNTQYPKRHHGHLLRNALIGLAVFAGLAIAIAVASK
jgi:hypothetical protein